MRVPYPTSNQTNGEIFYKSSVDGGRNWSADVRLTDAPRPSGSAAIAVEGDTLHVVWEDFRNWDPDNNVTSQVFYKHYPAPGPPPPTNLAARLEGPSLEHVNITWDDPSRGANAPSAHHYDIFYGEIFDRKGGGYAFLGSVPASNGTSSHHYLHQGAGEGDPRNLFYRVCSVNRAGNSTCASDQVGKYTRPLPKGMNLVSIPLVQSNESIERVLQTVSFDNAWSYYSLSREWKSFAKAKPHSKGLGHVNHRMALWVDVTSDSNLTIAGGVPTRTLIELRQGWNLVGFPSFADDYLVGDLRAVSAAERVEGFDALAPPYYLKVLGDGDRLQSGFGYWVLAGSATTWMVENS
jgi:hypothetical protein